MTRATYNATDGTLTELPDLDLPPDKPIEKNYWGNVAAFYRDMINWQRVMDAYNANALKITAVCRTIACSPECRGVFENEKVYEDGKDYEVLTTCKLYATPQKVPDHYCMDCRLSAFPLPVKSETDLPENSLILTAFQNEPVSFLLSNALRHLTQEQQMQLCNALRERLPPPASAEEEAVRMYPYEAEAALGELEYEYSNNAITDIERKAHITCAGMYTDTIDRLKAENEALKAELNELKTKNYGAKHNL